MWRKFNFHDIWYFFSIFRKNCGENSIFMTFGIFLVFFEKKTVKKIQFS